MGPPQFAKATEITRVDTARIDRMAPLHPTCPRVRASQGPNVSWLDRVHGSMIVTTIRRLGRSITVLLLLAGTPSVAIGQDAVSILEQAAEQYASFVGFCADFSQTIEVTLLGDVIRSRGELCQLRPDNFEMKFADPPRDRIVADGNDLWVYFPSTDEGQVFRTPLANSAGRFDLHREFLSDPGERYSATLEGTDQIDGLDMHILSLRPRVRSPYVHTRLWIGAADGMIRRLEILEESESIRTLDLTNMRIDPVIPQERFLFDSPSGVQVIVR